MASQIIAAPGRGFSFTVQRTKRKQRRLTLQEKLVRALNQMLSPETTFFAVPRSETRSPNEAAILSGQGVRAGVPDLIFISKGRVFGLDLTSEKASLSGAQRAAQVALRDAGMRVEVARSLGEAFEHLRDMGIPLRRKDDNPVEGHR